MMYSEKGMGQKVSRLTMINGTRGESFYLRVRTEVLDFFGRTIKIYPLSATWTSAWDKRVAILSGV